MACVMNRHDAIWIDLTEDVDMINDDYLDLTLDEEEEEEPLLSEFSSLFGFIADTLSRFHSLISF